jgi:Domain of unknown function (DUF1772)
MEPLVHFTCLFLTSILAGLMLGLLAYGPTVKKLPGAAFTLVHQGIVKTLTPVMIVLMPLTVLSSLPVLIVVSRSEVQPSFHFLAVIAGMGFTVAAVAATAIVIGPINRVIGSWSVKGPPATYIQYRERWQRYHALRTVFAVLGLVGQLLGAV